MLSGKSRARVEVSPYLTVIEEYTDNLFLSEDNEEDDWITTTVPGIGLFYDSVALEFDIDYSLKLRFYLDHSEDNETSLRDIQRTKAHGLLFPERDFKVFADGEIKRVSVDERGPGVEETVLVNSTILYTVAVNPQYRWMPATNYSVTFGYRYERSDYESGAGDDNESHEYSLLLNRRLSSNTELLVKYAFLDYREDFFQNFEQQTLTAGVAHQLGPRLTMEAEAGIAQIDYADGATNDWVTWNGSFVYNFSEALSLSLLYARDFTVSVSRGLIKGDNASALLSYESRASFEGRFYWSDDEYLQDETEDEVYGTALSLLVPIEDHYYAKALYDYKYLHFNPDDEKADRYTIGATIGYAFNTLDISLGYRFQVNESDIDVNDYYNNLVTLAASLRY